jgi:hypothetical protein
VLAVTTTIPRSKLAALDRKLKNIPVTMRAALREEVDEGLQEALAWMVANKLSGSPRSGKTTSTRLARRSGALIDSMATKTVVTRTQVRGSLYQKPNSLAKKYGRIHEFGGMIYPKRAQFLTIPLTEEARATRPRQVAGVFFIESRKGNRLLVRRLADGGIEPLWLLVDKVRMPARPYLRPTAGLWFPRISKRVAKRAKRVAREAAR